MVCLIINGDKLPSSEKLLEKLTKIPGMTSITYNINKEKTNVIMGSKVCPLWGQTYITDYIGNVKYQISPLSFYQVNPAQTEVLYGTALEYAGLTGKETVFCRKGRRSAAGVLCGLCKRASGRACESGCDRSRSTEKRM